MANQNFAKALSFRSAGRNYGTIHIHTLTVLLLAVSTPPTNATNARRREMERFK